jgi:hypothetical protein
MVHPLRRDQRQPIRDLIGRVLDVEPEGLASLNELCNQRRRGLLNDVVTVIDPAPHGSSLRGRLRRPGRCEWLGDRFQQLASASIPIDL